MASKAESVARVWWSWFIDQIIERGPALAAIVIAGGGMGYLAHLTEWINDYGPVAWGGIGLLSALVAVFGYFLYVVARSRYWALRFAKGTVEAGGANVLAPVHENERLSLSPFYSPYLFPIRNVRFENCELLGPANIVLAGGTASNSIFIECELVIVWPDRPVRGAIIFENSLIVNCRLYRVTLLVNIDHYKNLPEQMRKTLPVISDGRVGDV